MNFEKLINDSQLLTSLMGIASLNRNEDGIKKEVVLGYIRDILRVTGMPESLLTEYKLAMDMTVYEEEIA